MLSGTGSINGARAALGAQVTAGLQRRINEVLIESFRRWSLAGCPRFANDELNLTAPLIGNMIRVARERELPLTIKPESGEYSQAVLEGRADARMAPRVDVSITGGYLPYDVHYIIECKRLGRGATAPQYVQEGIARFVSGQYGPSSARGGMVAYVLTQTPRRWHSRVNRAIVASPQFTIADVLAVTEEFADELLLLRSRHVRADPMPDIELHHGFLDLTTLKET